MQHAEGNLIYVDAAGELACISPKAVAVIPENFDTVLSALALDLQLALDCIDLFGAVPLPVAQAILRNMEPAHAAIDMAIRCSPAKERLDC